MNQCANFFFVFNGARARIGPWTLQWFASRHPCPLLLSSILFYSAATTPFLILSSHLSGLPIGLRPWKFPSSTVFWRGGRLFYFHSFGRHDRCIIIFWTSYNALYQFHLTFHRALLRFNVHPKSFPKTGPNILLSTFLS